MTDTLKFKKDRFWEGEKKKKMSASLAVEGKQALNRPYYIISLNTDRFKVKFELLGSVLDVNRQTNKIRTIVYLLCLQETRWRPVYIAQTWM